MSKQYPEAAMTSDLEIIRVAASLIREYGDQANIEAAQRANALLEKGDLQAQSEWVRVVEAVEGIQSQIRLKDLGVADVLPPCTPQRLADALLCWLTLPVPQPNLRLHGFLRGRATGRSRGVPLGRPVATKCS